MLCLLQVCAIEGGSSEAKRRRVPWSVACVPVVLIPPARRPSSSHALLEESDEEGDQTMKRFGKNLLTRARSGTTEMDSIRLLAPESGRHRFNDSAAKVSALGNPVIHFASMVACPTKASDPSNSDGD